MTSKVHLHKRNDQLAISKQQAHKYAYMYLHSDMLS